MSAKPAPRIKLWHRSCSGGPSISIRTSRGGYKGFALAQFQAGSIYQTRNLPESLSLAEALARRAVALDGADAEARSLLGTTLWTKGDSVGARTEAERALAISPNLAFAHGTLGVALIFSGHPKEGVVALEKSLRLEPRGPQSAVRSHRSRSVCIFATSTRPRLRRRNGRSVCTLSFRTPIGGSPLRSARPALLKKRGERWIKPSRSRQPPLTCMSASACLASAGRPRPHARRVAQSRVGGVT
jgi:hypothetical protein